MDTNDNMIIKVKCKQTQACSDLAALYPQPICTIPNTGLDTKHIWVIHGFLHISPVARSRKGLYFRS